MSEAGDMAVTTVLTVAFALLVTVHASTVFGLARRRHLTSALGAFVVPVLAPYFAISKGMRARAAIWIASAWLYAGALALAN